MDVVSTSSVFFLRFDRGDGEGEPTDRAFRLETTTGDCWESRDLKANGEDFAASWLRVVTIALNWWRGIKISSGENLLTDAH